MCGTHRHVLRNGTVKMARTFRQGVARYITSYGTTRSDDTYVYVAHVLARFAESERTINDFFLKKSAISHNFTDKTALSILTKKIPCKILLHMQLVCSYYIDY